MLRFESPLERGKTDIQQPITATSGSICWQPFRFPVILPDCVDLFSLFPDPLAAQCTTGKCEINFATEEHKIK